MSPCYEMSCEIKNHYYKFFTAHLLYQNYIYIYIIQQRYMATILYEIPCAFFDVFSLDPLYIISLKHILFWTRKTQAYLYKPNKMVPLVSMWFSGSK